MENKINIAELLKDCPRGMELYSPLCGKCVFDRLNMGTIICKKQNTQEITFTSEGYYMLPVFDNCECMIFPSKDQRDWSKFRRPFKDGDILATNLGSVFFLNTRLNTDECYGCYVGKGGDGSFHVCEPFAYKECCGLATKKEKQKLFQAIKDNGYKWNAETKTLEKLIEPKFKVGDRIRHKNIRLANRTIISYDENIGYFTTMRDWVRIEYQNDWELVPDKFDITTLKPFKSRVLVRHNRDNKWCGSFFSHIDEDFHSHCYKFVTTAGKSYSMCIPYNEDTKHLIGTTKDCDEYYKTWE